ncbi:MAG: isochorismatase family protein [candidate division Zixibacteria bacterium]|jgi:isochorismate hydrolase|nr:isochorismatase family protein [candidate division Zixibacteria bacterium]
MKEAYFTPDRVEEQATQMLLGIENSIRQHQMRIAKGRAALLIVDMQDYFLQESSHAFVPSAPAIIPAVKMLKQAFETTQQQIILTRHINSPGDAGMMGRWWKELIDRDNPLSRITECLNTDSDTILEKTQYDAFHKTALGNILETRKVRQLVICGLIANLCCETTARSAFVRGYEVVLAVDGTATYNADLHRATLLNLAHGFASLVLTKHLLAELQ